jgi:hypothetical protein
MAPHADEFKTRKRPWESLLLKYPLHIASSTALQARVALRSMLVDRVL